MCVGVHQTNCSIKNREHYLSHLGVGIYDDNETYINCEYVGSLLHTLFLYHNNNANA